MRVRRVVARVAHGLNSFACWLRRGYPEWAPQSGHVPLVALCGLDGSQLERELRSSN
jgi:hypothetical protein